MPLNWIVSLIWWLTFVVAVASVWPDAYLALGRILDESSIAINLPDTMVIVPVMIGLTILQLIHGLAIKRRDILLST